MIGNRTAIAISTVLLLSLAADGAIAQRDRFWCGQRLIREGMAITEIVSRCGEPASIEVVEEPIFAWHAGGGRTQTGVAITEYWTYDRGSGRFPAKLTVRDNVAERIELLIR